MSLLDDILDVGDAVTKFAPDRFRAQFMIGFGYATNNRFQVEVPKLRGMRTPEGESVTDNSSSEERNMLCTAANMPGRDIVTTERLMGVEKRQIATGVTFPPVQLTFYLTNTYSIREYFGGWMSACVSYDENGVMLVGYQDNYVKDVKIRQYSRNGRKVASIKLIDAFPISMSSIELNNQPQSAVLELTVALAYRTYVEKYQQS